MPDRGGSGTAANSALSGVDHSVLGVHDLEAARARYARLGFTLTPRGRHIGWATANYCVMFADGYIELLGIVESGAFSAGLDGILAERGEGLLKLALGSGDAAATQAFLAAAGLVSVPVADLARELEAPGGTVRPAFRLVYPHDEATPGLPAFVCQHLTPGLVWRPEWCAHRNGATGVDSYAVVADEPAALAGGWARLFGDGAVALADGRLTVETGTARLEFMSRDALDEAFGGTVPAHAAAGTIAGVTVAVADLEAAAGCLAAAGVAGRRTGRGLVVPPADACGAVLAFRHPGGPG